MEAVVRQCRTCLSVSESEYLSIFAEENRTKKIDTIIATHLWFEIIATDESQWICQSCWSKLEEFHDFYTNIEETHKHQQTFLDDAGITARECSVASPDCTSPAYNPEFLEIKGEPYDIEETNDDALSVADSSSSDKMLSCGDIKSEESEEDEEESDSSQPPYEGATKRGKSTRSRGSKARKQPTGERLAKRKAGGRFPTDPEEDKNLLQFYRRIVCEVCDN
uniref:ZAD domain-containing protein n=1 Tax=Anopheles maculatus TaxID=74869 RepID=A0A182S8K1_9DIPT